MNIRLRHLLAAVFAAVTLTAAAGDFPTFDKNGVSNDDNILWGYNIDVHHVRLDKVRYGCIIYENNQLPAGYMQCFPTPTTTTVPG